MSDCPQRAAEQSLASDGAIACFSSNLIPLSLNADRAPQLKAIVGCLGVPMESKAETLGALLSRLDKLDDDLTIYAEEQPTWHSSSRAIACIEPEDGSLPSAAEGMHYFLEVFIAKEVAEGFVNGQVGNPTPSEICDRVIYYAKYDA